MPCKAFGRPNDPIPGYAVDTFYKHVNGPQK